MQLLLWTLSETCKAFIGRKADEGTKPYISTHTQDIVVCQEGRRERLPQNGLTPSLTGL